MKKSVLLLIAALVISGAVWAQIPGLVLPSPSSPGGIAVPFSFLGDAFDQFSAVPTESTESRYSAGRFDSDIDNYLDVNFYDPNIGTFFFLGGYPANTTVDDTDVLTSALSNNYAISFGLGKTFKSFYLGLYYGGSLVDDTTGAYGRRDGQDPEQRYSYYPWQNNLAVLVGTKGYGAFRLDMVLNTETETEKEDKDVVAKIRKYAPSFALTWGGIQLAGMDPYVTIGFKFPDKLVWGDTNPSKTLTYTEASAFALQAGVNYDLNETSSLSGDLVIGGEFGAKLKGDKEGYPGVYPGGGTGSVNIKEGGTFGVAIKAGYGKKFTFGKLALGFKPKVAIGFLRYNNNISGDTSTKYPSDNFLQFHTYMDMGLKFQANSKVALFTGASLQFFDWQRVSHSGGDDINKDKSKAWDFYGIAWDNSSWGSNNNVGGSPNILGFGMTVTPTANLVIGCGLNTILDKLFTINLKDMQVESGDYWNDATGSSNSLGALTKLFDKLTFDLTVSYKF